MKPWIMLLSMVKPRCSYFMHAWPSSMQECKIDSAHDSECVVVGMSVKWKHFKAGFLHCKTVIHAYRPTSLKISSGQKYVKSTLSISGF